MMNIKQIVTSLALIGTVALPFAASAAEPMVVKAGSFVSGAHHTSGVATIYKLKDGKRVLRLSKFETSNGPKVHVVLADHVVMGNHVVNAGSVDLGDLKGTSGNQNYTIPAGTNLVKVKSVAIYCERFHINFGTAKVK